MKLHLLKEVCICVFMLTSITTAQAAPVSGQGTWETTLQGRDLDGDLSTAEAYYDITLDVTWLADANYSATQYVNSGGVIGDADGSMSWIDANAWAASLDFNGITGWRLPTVSPINGTSFLTSFSTNATTDHGYAATTTDGTDGGWRDGFGNPVSELGHMFYVTLGNLGLCTPNDITPTVCTEQPDWGMSNTGPFSNIQYTDEIGAPIGIYWTDTTGFFIEYALTLSFSIGLQTDNHKLEENLYYSWAVHDGDVGQTVVPIPPPIIDIRPFNERNSVNPRSRGGLWVAILSNTDSASPFDPSSQVVVTTVKFGPDGANSVGEKVDDINNDGLGDLLLRFNIPETGIACGDTEATLTGETFDDQSFTGTDSIKTVGCKPKKCHMKKHHKKHHHEHNDKGNHNKHHDDEHKNR